MTEQTTATAEPDQAAADNAAYRYLSALATMFRTVAGNDRAGLITAAAVTDAAAGSVARRIAAGRPVDAVEELDKLCRELHQLSGGMRADLAAWMYAAGSAAVKLGDVAAMEAREARPLGERCEVRAWCTRTSVVRVAHPTLGKTPACDRCATGYEAV